MLNISVIIKYKTAHGFIHWKALLFQTTYAAKEHVVKDNCVSRLHTNL